METMAFAFTFSDRIIDADQERFRNQEKCNVLCVINNDVDGMGMARDDEYNKTKRNDSKHMPIIGGVYELFWFGFRHNGQLHALYLIL